MNAREITSITDLVLASEVFLLAGMLIGRKPAIGSAAWFWTLALLLLAGGALLAGVDHGFLEQQGPEAREPIMRACRLVVGMMAACMLVATALQFAPPKLARLIIWASWIQLAVHSVLVFLVDTYLIVILNYAPAMLLLLALNFVALRKGQGSWSMVIGVVVFTIASAVQALGIGFPHVDNNGLYHLGAMIGSVFLYRGGTRLTGF